MIDKICNSHLNLRNEEIIKGLSHHNHIADINKIETLVKYLKSCAIITQDNPGVVISNIIYNQCF